MSDETDNPTLIKQQRLENLYSSRWKNKLSEYTERKYYNFRNWEAWFEDAHQNLALKIDKLPADRNITDAFIFAVYKNELTSVVRKEQGYPRPRKWLLELSDMGQNLFEWMCLQKLSRTDILANVQKQSAAIAQTPASEVQTAEFKKMIEKILDMMLQKQECAGVRPAQVDDDSSEIMELQSVQPGTDEEADLEKLRLVLQLLIGDTDAMTQYMGDGAIGKLNKMREAIQKNPLLENTDTLILRCYYFQGMSQNDIAKMIKQPLQKVVRRREAAIKRLREFMESQGLDRQSLL